MRISRSGDYISQIRLISGRVFERMLSDCGVDAFNGPQGKILDVIWQQDGVPVSGISARTGLAGSTLTSMLDRMEAAGLARRVRSGSDRRVVLVYPGPRAEACREAYTRLSEEMTELMFDGFSEKELTEFESYLLRALTNLRHADAGTADPNKNKTECGEENAHE